MTRQEHMEWSKTRAREYLDDGDPRQAFDSMASDLNQHSETRGHVGLALGLLELMAGRLSTVPQMREFIEGFN